MYLNFLLNETFVYRLMSFLKTTSQKKNSLKAPKKLNISGSVSLTLPTALPQTRYVRLSNDKVNEEYSWN